MLEYCWIAGSCHSHIPSQYYTENWMSISKVHTGAYFGIRGIFACFFPPVQEVRDGLWSLFSWMPFNRVGETGVRNLSPVFWRFWNFSFRSPTAWAWDAAESKTQASTVWAEQIVPSLNSASPIGIPMTTPGDDGFGSFCWNNRTGIKIRDIKSSFSITVIGNLS